MLTFIVTHVGKFVQFYVLYAIHSAVYFEVTCIEDHLLMHSQYDRDFNHLSGWPLYILTVFYYYKACTSSPGPIRSNWEKYCIEDKYGLTPCLRCKKTKPFRSSHCRRCKVCISRRDHHCVFTNNCIGYANHKSFLWFLVFGFLGSMHFIVRGGFWIYEWYVGENLIDYSTFYVSVFTVHVYNMMGFAGLLGYLALKTVKNIHSNSVTMDSWAEKSCCGDSPLNGYDLGAVHNWTILLGENPFLWFSPYPPSKYSVMLGPDFPRKPELFNLYCGN